MFPGWDLNDLYDAVLAQHLAKEDIGSTVDDL